MKVFFVRLHLELPLARLPLLVLNKTRDNWWVRCIDARFVGADVCQPERVARVRTLLLCDVEERGSDWRLAPHIPGIESS